MGGKQDLRLNPKLSIFDTFKTKNELTGEAQRQRAIITRLATESSPSLRTRTAISQKIAEENGIAWKNIYSGIFHDLDEVLLPLGIAEEAGRLPLKRGPKALQEVGIPHYRLTQSGLLVALSLKEIGDKEQILTQFFSMSKSDQEFQNTILKLIEIAPRFVFSLFERYIKAYCSGKLENLLPFNLANLKKIGDDSLAVQREILEGFTKLSKLEKEKILNFVQVIS
ncbi:MAG: hypothetical protein FJ356_05335 [Thaumarchaeota archaeon]|nr:hypothetical protein [Nitrososphaerota archaeon]